MQRSKQLLTNGRKILSQLKVFIDVFIFPAFFQLNQILVCTHHMRSMSSPWDGVVIRGSVSGFLLVVWAASSQIGNNKTISCSMKKKRIIACDPIEQTSILDIEASKGDSEWSLVCQKWLWCIVTGEHTKKRRYTYCPMFEVEWMSWIIWYVAEHDLCGHY